MRHLGTIRGRSIFSLVPQRYPLRRISSRCRDASIEGFSDPFCSALRSRNTSHLIHHSLFLSNKTSIATGSFRRERLQVCGAVARAVNGTHSSPISKISTLESHILSNNGPIASSHQSELDLRSKIFGLPESLTSLGPAILKQGRDHAHHGPRTCCQPMPGIQPRVRHHVAGAVPYHNHTTCNLWDTPAKRE